jgi:hypothetical protein
MARVIDLSSDFKRRGVSYFIKDLGDDYIVVSNNRDATNSFVLMKIEPFAYKVIDQGTKEDILSTLDSIKKKISIEMSRRSKGR